MRRSLLSISMLILAACRADPNPRPEPGDDASLRSDAAAPRDAGRDARVSDAKAPRPDTGIAPSGPETQCDGVDNDGNDIIDDVDVGGDGVCDCLRVATLGTAANVGAGDVFASWLDARSSEGVVALGAQPLTAELLAPLQVLVVQNVVGRSFTQAEVDALTQWVEGGGGLITLSGYGGLFEYASTNMLLAATGLAYGTVPVLFGGLPPATLAVTEWEPHPVSEMVERVGFNNGYEVLGEGSVIARRDGVVVLRATELGKGRVLAWGDEWITINSEWKEHPDYDTERFWLNVFKWLSPPMECQVPILLL